MDFLYFLFLSTLLYFLSGWFVRLRLTLKKKNPSDVVVNISKNDSDNSLYQVSLNITQKLLVRIQGNITTGYEW